MRTAVVFAMLTIMAALFCASVTGWILLSLGADVVATYAVALLTYCAVIVLITERYDAPTNTN